MFVCARGRPKGREIRRRNGKTTFDDQRGNFFTNSRCPRPCLQLCPLFAQECSLERRRRRGKRLNEEEGEERARSAFKLRPPPSERVRVLPSSILPTTRLTGDVCRPSVRPAQIREAVDSPTQLKEGVSDKQLAMVFVW